tara:strand:+ start:1384 stop:1764 length:381 start_codon:yes stop_codon:yes gene_type:complete
MDLTKADALLSLKPNSEWTWDWDSKNPTVREYSKLQWLSSDTKPTAGEIDAELIKLTNAEPMNKLRYWRDRLLEDCDWMANSDVTMTDAWKTYRQALRDLPASTNPVIDNNAKYGISNVTWPTKPS